MLRGSNFRPHEPRNPIGTSQAGSKAPFHPGGSGRVGMGWVSSDKKMTHKKNDSQKKCHSNFTRFLFFLLTFGKHVFVVAYFYALK